MMRANPNQTKNSNNYKKIDEQPGTEVKGFIREAALSLINEASVEHLR